MKDQLFKRICSMILVIALLAGYYVPNAQAAFDGLTWKETDQKIPYDLSDRKVETYVEQTYAATDIVRVSIVLEDKPTIQAGFGTRNIAQNSQAMAYSRNLRAKQDTMAQRISAQVLGGQNLDVVWNLTLVGNVISANVPYGKISAIARVTGVKDVFVERIYEPCVVEHEDHVANPQMFSSLGMVGASQAWSSGYTGAGSRIAVIDTGTDTDHQSLDNGAFLYALEQNAQAAGVSYAEYVAGLNLLDTEEINSVLTDLNIYERLGSVTASDLYLNEKLAFAANYIDYDLTVDHEYDEQGEHGSHVAGIATANRYIPQGSGYVDALDTVRMAGMAPDAQLITMKVFGYYGGPSDADYLAAVEDAILLGCDAVNLSLGTSVAGTGFNEYYTDLLEYMTTTDTVVVASAGNSYPWPTATTFGYLYSDDVGFDTVGSPGSYSSFFTVASVENDGGVGLAFKTGGRSVAYWDASNSGSYEPFTVLDTSPDFSGTDYEYVFIDGLGYTEDYAGMDLEGKIVFCSRGSLNFAVKANNAVALGAVAVIVYNNQSDIFGMDLTGYYYTNPCVGISQADADAIRAASTERTTAGGLSYYTGKMTVIGKTVGINYNSEYYTMSDFSSWGVPGDLSLKPEITAPGGSIYSIYGETPYGGGTDRYELMSGTSMAAPAITGMVALLAQYLEESGLAEQEGMRTRALAQSLLMSTAVPMFEEASGGNYYSLMNQGAGLARVDLAAAADSYILVDGQNDGKVKAELGDDPDRTGVYTFSFSINNLSGEAETYALSADAFRQDVFEYQEGSGVLLLDTWTDDLTATATFMVNGKELGRQADLDAYDWNGDGSTTTEDADYLLEYLVGNETTLHGEGDINADGTVSTYDAHILLEMLNNSGSLVNVPAGGSITVTVRLTLSESSKAFLDANYSNGTYVEAFVYAESLSDDEGVTGTVHSIPMLAFYGNWSDPTMFDHSSYMEYLYSSVDHIPYLYHQIGSGNALTIDYGDGNEYYYGGNPFLMDDIYRPERNAFNSEDESCLAAQYFTLIRLATEMQLQVANADTGEVYFKRRVMGTSHPAFYNVSYGSWENLQQSIYLGWSGTDASGNPLPEDTNVEVTLMAIPEYYRNADGTHDYEHLGDGVYMTTRMVIDNTVPEVLSMNLVDTTLTVTARDNQYVAAVVLMNTSGSSIITNANPNQTVAEEVVSVDLDLGNVFGKTFLLAVYDYAGNVSVCEIELDLPELERPYLTVVDSNTNTYYGLETNGDFLELAEGDRGNIHAAEFVDGYVFEVSNGDQLYVAGNDDLNDFRYLADLDPGNNYGITRFLDLAFNYADGNLYGLFYCAVNSQVVPMLCTIDMLNGNMEVLCELPADVHTLAIDDQGNFYSAAYGAASLYTYTLNDLYSTYSMTYVGDMGYYGTSSVSSMAWDHDTDTLYWGFPNMLLKVNTANAEPTLLHYNNFQMVGLFVVPNSYGNRFAPTNTVSHLTIDQRESRTLVGDTSVLKVQVWPWNVSDDTVTWSSGNPGVATVDQNGVVTGVAVGTTTITATSNLDPTKSISCSFTVETLNKTLNALIWDEVGQIHMSEFDVTDLPDYTKLSNADLGHELASATMGQDGVIYAASLDMSTMSSSLYKLDPETFKPTLIGSSTDGYVDLAPAPGQPGNSLMAVYGGNVMHVDTVTGDYYNYYYMFDYNLVGIAYAGTQELKDWGFDTMVDWYFIIDRLGNVYLMGFLEQDGTYYYMEHDTLAPGGIYTQLGIEMDTPFFGSAYFDGEFLYFSAYREARNNVTLMAIDVASGSKACYTLGTFADGIWPVAGLMELGTTSLPDFMSVGMTSRPKTVEPDTDLKSMPVSNGQSKVVSGGLNAVPETGDAVPNSAGKYDENTERVILTLTPATELEGSTNGRMTVTYNPDELKLVSVNGITTAFAYATQDGSVEVAFASAHEMDGDTAVALLVFETLQPGKHEVSVLHTENGDGPFAKEEKLTIVSNDPTEQNPFSDVPEDQYYYEPVLWAVEEGITTGTGDGSTFSPSRACTRAQVVTFLWRAAGCPEPQSMTHNFTDVVAGSYYEKAVIWAVENGITSGKGSATTFKPDLTCTRAEVVTFLWRALDEPTPNSTVNPFPDVPANSYYEQAVLWAVENGITTGKGNGNFAPTEDCTRAHVVTFLYRAFAEA